MRRQSRRLPIQLFRGGIVADPIVGIGLIVQGVRAFQAWVSALIPAPLIHAGGPADEAPERAAIGRSGAAGSAGAIAGHALLDPGVIGQRHVEAAISLLLGPPRRLGRRSGSDGDARQRECRDSAKDRSIASPKTPRLYFGGLRLGH